MDQNKNQVMAVLDCTVNGLSYTIPASGSISVSSYYNADDATYLNQSQTSGVTLWNYWQNQYYPHVIKESYPVFIQERAMDKGKQAFELLKALMDKNLVKVDKVKDFIEAMDTILKTL